MSRARRTRAAAEPRGIFATLSAIAREIDVARETVRARLQAADVRPAAKRGPHQLYRVGEAFRACWDLLVERGAGADEFDPDKLNPFERQAHYKAESEKLRVAQMAGELCPREEVEETYAAGMKLIAIRLETLPDIIERDVGASPLVLQKIEDTISELREEIYRSLIEYFGGEEIENADEQESVGASDAGGGAAAHPAETTARPDGAGRWRAGRAGGAR